MINGVVIAILALTAALACSRVVEDAGSRLDMVRDRGRVVCATLDDHAGFRVPG